MWTLEYIKANNIAAFSELNYQLAANVTTLVFGNNLDNDSQGSNGSGKSALLEAIAIAVTGEPLRKVKIDEIINDIADEATVEAKFVNTMTQKAWVIIRTLSRKSPQQVECHMYANGEEVDAESTVQSSTAEYNRYILDTLGLTKEDIYSTFILSKHRYKCFLSSSDREKKEIINRFSNAVIVDEAIVKLAEDLAPKQVSLKEAELALSKCDGSVETLNDQLVQYRAGEAERQNSKPQLKQSFEQQIATKRENTRLLKDHIANDEDATNTLTIAYNQITEWEGDDKLSFEDCSEKIADLLSKHSLPALTDRMPQVQRQRQLLKEALSTAKDLAKEVKVISKQLESAQNEVDAAQRKLEKSMANDSKFEKQLESIQTTLDQLRDQKAKMIIQQENVDLRIAAINKTLLGVITCPECEHKFLIGVDADLADLRQQLAEAECQLLEVTDNIDANDKQQDSCKGDQSKIAKMIEVTTKLSIDVNRLTQVVNTYDTDIKKLGRKQTGQQDSISAIEAALSDLFSEMFDEAYDRIDDATETLQRNITAARSSISNNDGVIETLRRSIADLDIIPDSAVEKKLIADHKAAINKQDEARKTRDQWANEVENLSAQEQNFIGFKTHLANIKIDALGAITNDFLQQIGSDIRIKFSGYTVLKTGKLRDKISISIIRNGVDCGSFDKFSEGEKARVNLANILAMHKLTNVNCSEGKGLNLLVLDEILEATDEAGLSNIFEALNSLQITSLVVSHGNIAENYPYKLIVNKQNGVSSLNGTTT